MTGEKKDLQVLFKAQQEPLLATLLGGRAAHSHAETMGTAAELHWRKMLSEFLPTRYCVSKASVIDADGNASDQFDAVIHDRHFSPTWMAAGGLRYIPAESVYGVVEVKQDLTRGHIKYAIKKAESVRRLRRTSGNAPLVNGALPQPIIAAIVCAQSTWEDPLGDRLVDALALADERGRLNLGCALRHGSFEVSYPHDAPSLRCVGPETALIFFCMRLFALLQGVGSVVPLDVNEWSKPLY